MKGYEMQSEVTKPSNLYRFMNWKTMDYHSQDISILAEETRNINLLNFWKNIQF